MPCEVHSYPDIFGGAQIIMCGDGCGDVEAEPCAFCGAEAPYLCDWPVTRFESVIAHDVRIGDVIRDSARGETAIEMRVFDIHAVNSLLYFRVELLRVPKGARAQAKRYLDLGHLRHAGAIVPTAKRGTCDQSCCEAHAREIGEDRHYCREHWQAWQEVS
jgi:hypothetical protein